MVPPVRIELTASPLPRVRSTPELRRHPKTGHNAIGGRNVNCMCHRIGDITIIWKRKVNPAPAARKNAAPVRQKRCAPICNAASNRCVNAKTPTSATAVRLAAAFVFVNNRTLLAIAGCRHYKSLSQTNLNLRR